MNKKNSSVIDSSVESTDAEETSIITLLQCEYDSSEEENDYANSSQDSIDSSELVDSSDDEAELITEFYTLNKKVEKIGEKSGERNIETITA